MTAYCIRGRLKSLIRRERGTEIPRGTRHVPIYCKRAPRKKKSFSTWHAAHRLAWASLRSRRRGRERGRGGGAGKACNKAEVAEQGRHFEGVQRLAPCLKGSTQCPVLQSAYHLCVYVCVCACVCMCVCVCVYNMNAKARLSERIPSPAQHLSRTVTMYVYMFVYIHIYVCMHACMHTYMHTYMHVCMHACVSRTCRARDRSLIVSQACARHRLKARAAPTLVGHSTTRSTWLAAPEPELLLLESCSSSASILLRAAAASFALAFEYSWRLSCRLHARVCV